MRILALDLGTICAMALGTEKVSRLEDWDFIEDAKRGVGDLYLALCDALDGALGVQEVPNVLAYEEPPPIARASTRALFGLAAMCEMFAARVGATALPLNVKSIKKFATGHGNASKVDMYEAAKKGRPDLGFPSEHCVDAFWVWQYAKKELAK